MPGGQNSGPTKPDLEEPNFANKRQDNSGYAPSLMFSLLIQSSNAGSGGSRNGRSSRHLANIFGDCHAAKYSASPVMFCMYNGVGPAVSWSRVEQVLAWRLFPAIRGQHTRPPLHPTPPCAPCTLCTTLLHGGHVRTRRPGEGWSYTPQSGHQWCRCREASQARQRSLDIIKFQVRLDCPKVLRRVQTQINIIGQKNQDIGLSGLRKR